MVNFLFAAISALWVVAGIARNFAIGHSTERGQPWLRVQGPHPANVTVRLALLASFALAAALTVLSMFGQQPTNPTVAISMPLAGALILAGAITLARWRERRRARAAATTYDK